MPSGIPESAMGETLRLDFDGTIAVVSLTTRAMAPLFFTELSAIFAELDQFRSRSRAGGSDLRRCDGGWNGPRADGPSGHDQTTPGSDYGGGTLSGAGDRGTRMVYRGGN